MPKLWHRRGRKVPEPVPARSFLLSLGLHLAVLGLMFFQIQFGTHTPKEITPALMVVDLTKVQLADKTNLPPKIKPDKTPTKPVAKPVPKPKEKPKVQPKENKTPRVNATPPKPAKAPKPVPQKPVKDAVSVKQTPTAKPQKKKADSKPKTPPKKVKQTPSENPMDSLLKSVRKIQKPLDPVPSDMSAPEVDEVPVSNGIEGGKEGNLSRVLTISEQDLIANQLRRCWNVNAGVAGVEDMIIEISATVGRDGRIKTVKINNMKNDPAFRTTAESARRAVWVCDKREDSPFKILAEKYASQYDSWKELFLRFNPLEGSVF